MKRHVGIFSQQVKLIPATPLNQRQRTLFPATALTFLEVLPIVPASSSSSFSVFLFCVILGVSNSKLAFLWQKNPCSMYDQSSSTSTVFEARPKSSTWFDRIKKKMYMPTERNVVRVLSYSVIYCETITSYSISSLQYTAQRTQCT